MADVEVNEDNTNHQELYGQGIKAYLMQDFDAAVKAFSRVSELLVQELNDDLHDDLGDVYLYYGKSLLELARKDLENTCLNKNLIKNAESSDDEAAEGGEGEEEEGEEEESGGGGGDTSQKESKEVEDENKTETEKPESTTTEDPKPEASTSTADAGPSTSKTDNNESEDKEDELTDLQVAWEVLELARTIFSKRSDKGKKDLAETMISLGEVSLEGGNFAPAIEDMLSGLEIQKTIFANDSRAIAETYYKLGGAYYCNKQVDEAIESFQSSYDYLKCRLNNLKKNVDATEDEQDEIKELEELIPEVEEKIADMKSYKVEQSVITKSIEEDKKEIDGNNTAPSSSSSSSKQATDISHLVKRKRPSDGPATNGTDENPAKKPSP